MIDLKGGSAIVLSVVEKMVEDARGGTVSRLQRWGGAGATFEIHCAH